MRKTGLLLLAVFCAVTAVAQDHQGLPPNTVYIGATGKFEANPDVAIIQFNIAAQEATAKDAYDRAAKGAEQVRQIMRSNGIDPKTAQIGYYSIAPVQEWHAGHAKVVGYQVSASVTLKLKDFSKIGPIVQQLADADITANNSINYTLDDVEAAKTKAVQDAYVRARASADALATSAGRALGEMVSATVDISENTRIHPMMPMAKMAMAQAAPAPTEEFSPQTVSVTAHANVTFALK